MKTNNQRIALTIALFLIMISSVTAVKLCAVSQFEDEEPLSKCFEIDENADGVRVFEQLATLTLSPNGTFGRLVCKVDGKGTEVQGNFCQFSGKFWNFAKIEGNEWKHMPIGLDGGPTCWNRDINFNDFSQIVHYCATEGDTVALAFGDSLKVPDMLKIKDFKAFVDGSRVAGVNLSDTRINYNITPGAEVRFKVELENLYDGDTDIEITDIEVRLTLEDIDDDSDLKEEVDSIDLNPEQTETVELLFVIPTIVASGDYNLDVDIIGKDDRNIKYNKDLSYKLIIDKERHQLIVNSIELDRKTYKCERSALLDVEIYNIGEKNEDGTLLVTSAPLALSLSETFDLDNDPFEDESKLRRKFQIPLKGDLASGNYDIEVEAHYASKFISGKTTLRKEACPQPAAPKPATPPQETAPEEQTIHVQEAPQTSKQSESQTPESTKTKQQQNITVIPEQKSDFALILAGLGLLAIIGVIVILGLYLILNKKTK